MKVTIPLLLVIYLVSIAGYAEESQAQKNKDVLSRAVAAINSRDWKQLDGLFVPDYRRHSQATPDVRVQSLEEFKSFLKLDAEIFQDSQMTMQHMLAEADFVAFYGAYSGTQNAPMGPFPASNKKASIDFSGIHRFEDGRIAETWITWDNLAFLGQLGHVEPPSGESAPNCLWKLSFVPVCN